MNGGHLKCRGTADYGGKPTHRLSGQHVRFNFAALLRKGRTRRNKGGAAGLSCKYVVMNSYERIHGGCRTRFRDGSLCGLRSRISWSPLPSGYAR